MNTEEKAMVSLKYKLYNVGDETWAATSLQDVISAIRKQTGEEVDEGDVYELTDADMNRMRFVDDDTGERMSFRNKLIIDHMNGINGPYCFASEDY